MSISLTQPTFQQSSQSILPPLSLYIHMPWCVRKCPYCDFNSHTLRTELPEKIYIAKLLADLDQDLPKVAGRALISIFIGGGTPSLFSPEAFNDLLLEIRKRIPFTDAIEITLEANPGTVEYARFAGYRQAGINRLSIGIQSFQADKLTALGRIHDNQQAIRAAETAYAAGFTNFNLDLMHGLPNQTHDDALHDLQTAIALHPTHLSWYQLTLEPNTLFHKYPPSLPPEDFICDMQDKGRDLLAQHHFIQYEISAYAQADKQCRHNINYWQFGDYLGIGAGAHGKITDSATTNITRSWKLKNPKEYLQANTVFIGDSKIIPANELAFEFMLNALRLYQTIPVTLFYERTGLTFSDIAVPLEKARQQGLVEFTHEVIIPTDLGRKFYNDLVEIFI